MKIEKLINTFLNSVQIDFSSSKEIITQIQNLAKNLARRAWNESDVDRYLDEKCRIDLRQENLTQPDIEINESVTLKPFKPTKKFNNGNFVLTDAMIQ